MNELLDKDCQDYLREYCLGSGSREFLDLELKTSLQFQLQLPRNLCPYFQTNRLEIQMKWDMKSECKVKTPDDQLGDSGNER